MPRLSSFRLSLWLLAACSAACGSSKQATSGGEPEASATSKNGSASASGTVEGHALTPTYAAFASGIDDQNAIYIVLSNQNEYCDNVAAGITHPDHTSIVLGLSTVASDASTPRPAKGAYPIVTTAPESAGNQAQAGFYVSNATCKNALTKSKGAATGGSVTLNTVTDTRVAGTFTLAVGSDNVSGTFDTVFCQGLKDEIKNNVSLSCQPQ